MGYSPSFMTGTFWLVLLGVVISPSCQVLPKWKEGPPCAYPNALSYSNPLCTDGNTDVTKNTPFPRTTYVVGNSLHGYEEAFQAERYQYRPLIKLQER